MHKPRRRLILFVDGALKALRFKTTDETMNPFWTLQEAKEFVAKALAHAFEKRKPMTLIQFSILLIPLVFIAIVAPKTAMHLGAL